MVSPLHGGQNVLGHVTVKGLRVALQSAKQTKGLTPGFDFFGGKTGWRKGNKQEENKTVSDYSSSNITIHKVFRATSRFSISWCKCLLCEIHLSSAKYLLEQRM